jgi:hypothetical protein
VKLRLPSALIALAAWSSGCLPPDAPPNTPAAADPDEAALRNAWRVDGHLLGKRTSLSAEDAARSHGRTVSISGSGYATPWHGTCEEAGSARRERPLAEVAAELAIDWRRMLRLGFTDPLVEHRLSCTDPVRRAPSLTVYVANAHALTCYSGICYVLVH